MDGDPMSEPFKIIKNDADEACGPGCECSGADGQGADGAAPLELDDVQERLAGASGKKLWRSLEELAETPEFEDMLHREFPRLASEWDEGVSRRRFLQLSSASLALAGLTACTRQPEEQIVPYVHQPEEITLGRPLFFATAFSMGGYAQGVLAESHEGRPTKIEGNGEHPANPGGGTDLFAQASILSLYDPDRSGVLTHLGQIRTWSDFKDDFKPRIQALRSLKGSGLRILTRSVTSPTLAAQLDAILTEMPEARWHQWEPAGRHNVYRGAVAAFGEPVEVRYDLTKADVVLALDSDFLTQGPGAVRYAREWSDRRRAGAGAGVGKPDPKAMNRLYAVETCPSNTGASADHRLDLAPTDLARFALALAGELGVPGAPQPETLDGEAGRWLTAVARDLRSHGSRGLVVVGDGAPPAVHAFAHAINQVLGAAGESVVYTEPVAAHPTDEPESLASLVEALRAGDVEILLILGGNPVFDAPADLGFADALTKASLRVHVGLYDDETAQYCQWHLPQAHYLESWSDTRSADGTVAIVQPLVDPLYKGHTFHEILAQLTTDRTDAGAYDLVREHWKGQGLPGGDFELAWRKVLNDGVVPGTALPAKQVTAGGVSGAVDEIRGIVAAKEGAAGGPSSIELLFRPDPTIWDGSFANNGWLQELPKPVTRLTWDNALLLSPTTAAALGVHDIKAELFHERPKVKVAIGETSVELPVWVVPGHADGAGTVHFGHGRTRAGQVGDKVGVDVYPLRTREALWQARAGLTRVRGKYLMATTQDHHSMEGRNLARSGTLAEYVDNPAFIEEMNEEGPGPEISFYPGFEYPDYKWGMAVDLNACTGCNACVIACQSENNIPIVGKEQVARGREMHWIRIDRYFESEGPEAISAIHHQPVLCQQCEQAPCEVVCPVGATVHSSEGLNDMVYNRCVGTRYCSNNCPYKVRRFNFLKYTDQHIEVAKMGRNPDVTVRMRGVMEKCTYCVQRISHARIDAKVAGQRGRGDGKIHDGDVRTACQQACPSDALIFGDLNDPDARVTRRKAEPLNYTLLRELATRPRTTYLARLRNPNPALENARRNA